MTTISKMPLAILPLTGSELLEVIQNGKNRKVPVSSISQNPGGSSGVIISATAPASPSNGMQWWDSTIGVLKIYYNDGTSSQWVDAMASTAGTQGLMGIQGFGGIQGTTGPQGIQGTSGPDGTQGATGSNGTQGTAGAVGVPSPRGCTILSPQVGDKVVLFYTPTATTVSKIWATVNTGVVTYDIAGAATISTATYTCLSNATSHTTPTAENGPFSISGFVWVEIKGITGSPSSFNVTMEY